MHLFTAEALNGLPPFPRRNAVVEDLAKNDAMICGAVSIPSGEVDNRRSGMKFVEDGDDLVGNGKLGFASMSEGAKYIFASGTINRGEGTEPDIVLAFPDMSTPGLINLKNWDAMGFRSTASHDIQFDNLRIPKAAAMVAPVAMIRLITQAQAADPSAGNRRPRGVLGILAIWMGLAQAAYDFTLEYVGQRHGMVAGDSTVFGQVGYRSAEPWAQYGIGEMDHWLSTGRLALYDMCRRAYDDFPTVNAFNHEMVRTIYTLRRMSEEISAASMRICGAHAYLRNRSLERIFRDQVGCNVMAWKTDQLRQTLGQAALGLPITVGGPAPT
jgi:alkylation response protein AidB-like acyl-CoA dehydrogenase